MDAKSVQLIEEYISKYSVRWSRIGLYVSKMIIEAHGGTLIAESDGIHKGATFIFELPLLLKE